MCEYRGLYILPENLALDVLGFHILGFLPAGVVCIRVSARIVHEISALLGSVHTGKFSSHTMIELEPLSAVPLVAPGGACEYMLLQARQVTHDSHA